MSPRPTPEDLAVEAFGPDAADFRAGWRANTIHARRATRKLSLDADELRLMVGVLADDVEALRETLAAAAEGAGIELDVHEDPRRGEPGAGEELLVVRRPGGYWVRFAAGRGRADMLERFGTDELAIPFRTRRGSRSTRRGRPCGIPRRALTGRASRRP